MYSLHLRLCRTLHAYPATIVISSKPIVCWLLPFDRCQWCHWAEFFHYQGFKCQRCILTDKRNFQSFVLRIILAIESDLFEISRTVNWQRKYNTSKFHLHYTYECSTKIIVSLKETFPILMKTLQHCGFGILR